MKRHGFFLAIMIILALAVGMIIIEKFQKETQITKCKEAGGTWNFMEGKCDQERVFKDI